MRGKPQLPININSQIRRSSIDISRANKERTDKKKKRYRLWKKHPNRRAMRIQRKTSDSC